MINNYFCEDEYSPCDQIYVHPVHQNGLHLGDMAAAADIPWLQDQKITTVITVAAGMDHLHYPPQLGIAHIVFSVLDSKAQDVTPLLHQAHDIIEERLSQGSVLVHCAAGVSRSATFVLAYLMRHKEWTFREAIAFVRESRPKVCPNLGFERQLKDFEKIILKKVREQLPRRISKTS